MTAPPEVVAFDVNETLLDLAPVRAELIEAGAAGDLLPTVFARTLLTGFAAAAVGGWCRFRDAFDAALAQASDLGPGGAGRGRRRLRRAGAAPGRRAGAAPAGARPASGWSPSPTAPPAWPRPGWRAAGIDAAGRALAVQRGHPRLEARPRGLPLGGRRLRRRARTRMALVAAHGWDVLGAQRAGLTGAWFPRSERSYPAVYDAAARDGRRPGRRRRRAAGAAGRA